MKRETSFLKLESEKHVDVLQIYFFFPGRGHGVTQK
jgi:hypothetical protein